MKMMLNSFPWRRAYWIFLGPLFVALFFSGSLYSQTALNTSNGINMPLGVTEMSAQMYGLHMIVFYICVVIGVFVFGAMFYSMYHHRKSRGAVASNFHEDIRVEIIWTIIPLLVLIAVAVPATELLIEREDVSKADLNIKVTGQQWKWHYKYLDGDAQGIDFYSNLDKRSRVALRKSIDSKVTPSYEKYLANVDNRLIIPTGRRVRLLVTSDDVIHSWWVPDFGVKQDAIPGFINATWVEVPVGKEGVYRGVCTELCGRDHAYMPVVVEAVPLEEYRRWVGEYRDASVKAKENANKVFSAEELLSRGQDVYSTYCFACHQADGKGIAGVFPSIVESKIATGLRAEHIQFVLNGKNAMPSFRGQLDNAQVAAVIHYQRNRLNSVGDVTQPSDVKAQR